MHQLKHSIFTILRSAGVGRTGTYIAIDNLTEEIRNSGKVDVVNAVMKMRQNRKDMIQNTVRYKEYYEFVFFITRIMFTNMFTNF